MHLMQETSIPRYMTFISPNQQLCENIPNKKFKKRKKDFELILINWFTFTIRDLHMHERPTNDEGDSPTT